jgi:anaerobic ribonucleoside-triphosphate reductase activating protein
MRYAGIIPNDTSNAGAGVCFSFYTQGCPHKCEGCHNPDTWSPEGGHEFTTEVLNEILAGIGANGIKRNFCVLGGEPLSDDNVFLTYLVIDHVRKAYPDIRIYLWTGYTYDELQHRSCSQRINDILSLCDILIDGKYEQSLRDVTLPLRGSVNQRIINLKQLDTTIEKH